MTFLGRKERKVRDLSQATRLPLGTVAAGEFTTRSTEPIRGESFRHEHYNEVRAARDLYLNFGAPELRQK